MIGAAGDSARTSADAAGRLLTRLRATIGEAVLGYDDVVEALAVALVIDGHVLLEGLPGIAKTYLARSFARAIDLSFRRIQFTPDMLPADILGGVLLDPASHQFEFRPGPIFANVVLADEINRAPPKVQSALLEAMQERQVTVDGRSFPLPTPFLVVATQNPLDHEGTYPLPQAELDRFLFRWLMPYPDAATETRVVQSQLSPQSIPGVAPVVTAAEIEKVRASLDSVHIEPEIFRYVTEIVRATRVDPGIYLGASPRAAVQFMRAVRADCLYRGQTYVTPDDVIRLAMPILNHRIGPAVLDADARRVGTGPGARAEWLNALVMAVIARVEVPR